MNIYQGRRLERFVDARLTGISKARECQTELNGFLADWGAGRAVCGVYGLRRTGKTTMCLVAMRELGIVDRSAYILCYPTDN